MNATFYYFDNVKVMRKYTSLSGTALLLQISRCCKICFQGCVSFEAVTAIPS